MQELVYPELAEENLVPLARAGELFPIRVSASTIQRYWRDGVRGNRLQTYLIGGRRFTSLEQVRLFVERSLSMDSNGDDGAFTASPKRNAQSGRKKFDLPSPGKNGQPLE